MGSKWWLRAGAFLCALLLAAPATWAQAAKSPADQLYDDAMLAVAKRDLPQAEFLLRELSMRFPQDKRWGVGLLTVLEGEGHIQDGLKLARELEPSHSSSAEFHLAYGRLLIKADRPDQAIAEYKKALSVATTPVDRYNSYYLMGDAYEMVEDFDAAIASHRKAKEISGRASFGLAHALSEKGDLDGAIAEYRGVLRDSPDEPIVMNNLAYSLAERDTDLGEALELAIVASSLVPGDSPVTDTLGWVYYKLGRYEDAERVLAKALGQEGGLQPVLREHLANIMDARRAWTDDRRELRDLLEKAERPKEVTRLKELLKKVEDQ